MEAEKKNQIPQQYSRKLHMRLAEAANRLSERYPGLVLKEMVHPVTLDRVLHTFADVPAKDVVALDTYGGGGKHGLVLAEDGVYTSDFGRIPFAELETFQKGGQSDTLYVAYADGTHKEHVQLNTEQVLALLEAGVHVYQKLCQEIRDGEASFTLASVEGWSAFQDSRKRSLFDSRKNCVFVSSTFRDMHYERDAIHESVMPALNEIAGAYGENLSFCDLRWGVNTAQMESEDGARKVLSVCLNEIENCRPYMLVILGERYGWIPQKNLVLETEQEWFADGLDDLEKSVTALEIEFGALNRKAQLDRTLFYFREMKGSPSEIYLQEDDRHAAKLAELKRRILKIAPGQVKSYTLTWDAEMNAPQGMDSFVEMVTEDIRDLMESEWEEIGGLPSQEKEDRIQWQFAQQKAMLCTARDNLLHEMLEEIEFGTKLTVLQGVSGSGKSTVMGALAEVLRLSKARVCPVFCGSSERSNTPDDLMRRWIYFLEQELGAEHMPQETLEQASYAVLQEKLNQLAQLYEEEGKEQLIFLVDALDQFPESDARDGLKFFPQPFSAKICAVISCTETFPTQTFQNVKQIPPLTYEERVAVIRENLKAVHRELEDKVIETIASRTQAENPFYMYLLLQRLLLMDKEDFDEIVGMGDGMEAISARQIQLIKEAPQELPQVNDWLLGTAFQKLHNPAMEEAVRYLAVSRNGLRESDLEGLMQQEGFAWSSLDFSLLTQFVNGIFRRKEDGTVDFVHKSTREEILESLGDVTDRYRKIGEWLSSLSESDHLRQEDWIFYCCCGGDAATLIACADLLWENDAGIRQLARQILMACRKVGDEWLLRFLASNDFKMSHGFLQVLFQVYRQADVTENTRMERILKACLPAAEQCAGAGASADAAKDLSLLYYDLGDICDRRGGEENHKRAVSYFEKSLEMDKSLYEREKTAQSRRSMAVDCRRLGSSCRELASEGKEAAAQKEYRERAFAYFAACAADFEELARDEEEIGSKKDLAILYREIAYCYDENGADEAALQKAEDYYLKAYQLREEIVAETGEWSEKRNFAYSCRSLAVLYRYWGDEQHKKKALPYYRRETELWTEVLREDRNLDSLKRAADAWCGLGWALDQANDFKTQDTPEEAANAYEKGAALYQTVCRSKPEEERGYADACVFAGLLRRHMTGAANQAKAYSLYLTALPIREKLVQQENSAEAHEDLCNLLIFLGRSNPDMNIQAEFVERALQETEYLYAKTKDPFYKKQKKMLNLLNPMVKGFRWFGKKW